MNSLGHSWDEVRQHRVHGQAQTVIYIYTYIYISSVWDFVLDGSHV